MGKVYVWGGGVGCPQEAKLSKRKWENSTVSSSQLAPGFPRRNALVYQQKAKST